MEQNNKAEKGAMLYIFLVSKFAQECFKKQLKIFFQFSISTVKPFSIQLVQLKRLIWIKNLVPNYGWLN